MTSAFDSPDELLDGILHQTHAALGEATDRRLARAGGPAPLHSSDTALDALLAQTHNTVGHLIAVSGEDRAQAGSDAEVKEQLEAAVAAGQEGVPTAAVTGPQGLPLYLYDGTPDAAGFKLAVPSPPVVPPRSEQLRPWPWVPRLTGGLRLHGEYAGSGFTEPKYLARRGDGQMVQLSRLLYLVAASIDGERDTEAIAQRVTARFGRPVSSANIVYLLEKKLEPLGVTVPFGQETDEVAQAPRSDLLLALKGHRVLFGERLVAWITRPLVWLHKPLAVAAVLTLTVAMDVWLFGFFGAVQPVLDIVSQPLLLTAVCALTMVSLVFHELGHASACRYGGARPGVIGVGLFSVWPSLYTDVTDVYRLGRVGRLRTDLGGIYFNAVFMLGLTGAYFLTGQQFLLAAVLFTHLLLLEQMMPVARLDGYYILGDLAQVPDLYGKVWPAMRSLIPGAPKTAEVAGLKRSSRVLIAVWVLGVAVLYAAFMGLMAWNAPQFLHTAEYSIIAQLSGTAATFRAGSIGSALLGVLGSLLLLVPLTVLLYLSAQATGRLVRSAFRSSRGKVTPRTFFLVAACSIALAAIALGGVTPVPSIPYPTPIAPALQPGVHTPVVP